MIGKSGQNGLFHSRFSILGQPPRITLRGINHPTRPIQHALEIIRL
ncbi:MAG: hypothetical protein V3V31_05005 [Methylococcales bacterium]